MGDWKLFGVKGWGSALAECALAWAGVSYRFEDVTGFDQPGSARDVLAQRNPLLRVPTLVTPQGDTLTESGAILLAIDARHPGTGLVPSGDSGLQPTFFNRLFWFVSALYPTFSYRDYPERWVPSAPHELRQSVDAFRRSLWLQFESEAGAGPFVLGTQPCGLDIYLTVMTHWRPGRDWIKDHCPNLYGVAMRTQELAALRTVMDSNFP